MGCVRMMLLGAGLALGCGGAEAPPEPSPRSAPAEPSALTSYGEVTVDELAKAMGSGEVQLVDVRTRGEYESGHVPGAKLFPLNELALTDPRIHMLDKSRPVYLICASGSRSAQAAAQFAAAGWEANNVQGGTRAWIASGREVE